MKKFLLFIFLFFCPVVSLAVEPDEILENHILEERARLISKDLRCLVCQNENIDSSNAELAKDLRVLVRERILLGDTNKQVKDFIVYRYGEYVLLNPRFSGSTLFLWIDTPHGFACLTMTVPLPFGKDLEIVRALNMSL